MKYSTMTLSHVGKAFQSSGHNEPVNSDFDLDLSTLLCLFFFLFLELCLRLTVQGWNVSL